MGNESERECEGDEVEFLEVGVRVDVLCEIFFREDGVKV